MEDTSKNNEDKKSVVKSSSYDTGEFNTTVDEWIDLPGWHARKADLLHRALARIIDALFFVFLCGFYPVGVLGGLLYIMIADGFMSGRSIGKRLIGIRVVNYDNGEVAGFKESIFRNLPFLLLGLFFVIPLIGWILFFTAGLLILAIEIYMINSDKNKQRAGDILAQTVVVMAEPFTDIREDREPPDTEKASHFNNM